jgi:hypothetical protein
VPAPAARHDGAVTAEARAFVPTSKSRKSHVLHSQDFTYSSRSPIRNRRTRPQHTSIASAFTAHFQDDEPGGHNRHHYHLYEYKGRLLHTTRAVPVSLGRVASSLELRLTCLAHDIIAHRAIVLGLAARHAGRPFLDVHRAAPRGPWSKRPVTDAS